MNHQLLHLRNDYLIWHDFYLILKEFLAILARLQSFNVSGFYSINDTTCSCNRMPFPFLWIYCEEVFAPVRRLYDILTKYLTETFVVFIMMLQGYLFKHHFDYLYFLVFFKYICGELDRWLPAFSELA